MGSNPSFSATRGNIITAQEAQDLRTKAITARIAWKTIEELIETAASAGGREVIYDLLSIPWQAHIDAASQIENKLKPLGYKTKRDTGGDPRDMSDDYDHIVINW